MTTSSNISCSNTSTADLISYLDSHPHHLIVGDYPGQNRHLVLGVSQSRHLIITITDVKQVQADEEELEEKLHQVNLNTAATSTVEKQKTKCTHILVRGRVTSHRPRGTLTAPFSGQLNPETGFLQLTFSVEEIKNARPLLHSFLASLTVCSFHVQWKCAMTNDRGKIVISGSVGEEHYECQCDIGTSLSVPRGCPLILQPVSTLALICRYLDATSLIAVYKTNPQLSSAASHPITHQSGNEVAIDSSSLDAPRSYLINGGMTCAFNSLDKMRAAFSSRLLRHIRSVKINSDSSEATELDSWMSLFLLPVVPPLRCLKIVYSYSIGKLQSTLTPLLSSACFQYLRLLHLTVTPEVADVFCSHLPLSLELLHLTFMHHHFVSKSVIPMTLIEYLKTHAHDGNRSSHLRKLLFNNSSSGWLTTIEDLRRLKEIEDLNVIDEMHWLVSFDPLSLNGGLASAIHLSDVPSMVSPDYSSLRIATIRALRIPSLVYRYPAAPVDLTPLSSFVNLSTLQIDLIAGNALLAYGDDDEHVYIRGREEAVTTGHYIFPRWPDSVRSSLTDLTVLFPSTDRERSSHTGVVRVLEAAKLNNLIRLNLKTDSIIGGRSNGLPLMYRLFQTMPLLTELSLSGAMIEHADCFCFGLLPQLKIVKELRWPTIWTNRAFKEVKTVKYIVTTTTVVAEKDGDVEEEEEEEEEDETIDEPETHTSDILFSSLFPSLTTLHVASSPQPLPYQLLRQIAPQLSHFKWLNEEWIHSYERIEWRCQQAEIQYKQSQHSTRSHRIAVIVQQQLDAMVSHIISQQIPLNVDGVITFDPDAADMNQSHENWYKGDIKREKESGDSVSARLLMQQKLATVEISKSDATQPTNTFQFSAQQPFSFDTLSTSALSLQTTSSSSSSSSAMFGSSSFSFSPTPIATSTNSMTSSFTVAATTFAANSTPSIGTSSFPFSTALSGAAVVATSVPPTITTSSASNPFSTFTFSPPTLPVAPVAASSTSVSSDAAFSNAFSSQLTFGGASSASLDSRSSFTSNPFSSSFGSATVPKG